MPSLSRDPRFKQGIYTPKYKEKFIGKIAIYRSSFELQFMRWADNNPNVLEWGSENIIVPYKSPIDNKVHRYYVDNFLVLKEGETIKKYLVEIKPSSQTQKPVHSNRKKKQTILYENAQYAVNMAKWEAAKLFAKHKGFEFIILTEKELFSK
jgi:hypothetical protein